MLDRQRRHFALVAFGILLVATLVVVAVAAPDGPVPGALCDDNFASDALPLEAGSTVTATYTPSGDVLLSRDDGRWSVVLVEP